MIRAVPGVTRPRVRPPCPRRGGRGRWVPRATPPGPRECESGDRAPGAGQDVRESPAGAHRDTEDVVMSGSGEEKSPEGLTHLDGRGRARMVDVSGKPVTVREALARARVTMKPSTLRLIVSGEVEKGDVLAVARVAGIMAAKKAGELIPMCHPIAVTSVQIDFQVDESESSITVLVTVRTRDRTGVEMEALTGAAVAALTIYDMCKAVDRSMTVTDLQLLRKEGGRSGTFVREEEDDQR